MISLTLLLERLTHFNDINKISNLKGAEDCKDKRKPKFSQIMQKEGNIETRIWGKKIEKR